MPLLPYTRRILTDNLDEVESRMDRWVSELDGILGSATEHKAVLDDCKTKLTRLRRGFQAARETNAEAT